MKAKECILFSGGVQGAEAEFGAQAQKKGVEEVNFTFEGHRIERTRGVRYLSSEDLVKGDVSLSYISKMMNRKFSSGPLFRKVLQSIWHQINNAEEVFVVGRIQDDNTVKGGTGWGAEFAKLCNKPLSVFDQNKNEWSRWTGVGWEASPEVKIGKRHFCGTGTRFLTPEGKKAIAELFERSFG